jgi:hypothetical protein
MKSFKEFSEGLAYHLENKIPLAEQVYRYGSTSYFDLINEARLHQDVLTLSETDKEILATDIGTFAIYEGVEVPLDFPMLAEAEYHGKKVDLDKPKRGGTKKYYVYVKNAKGNIIKIAFGDTSGLKEKINDPVARKSFAARHQCHLKNDKTTAGYWSCRLTWFAKSLGLSGGSHNYFW